MTKKIYNNNISEAAAALGRKGGSVKSEKKAKAARENGKKGGRPRKKKEGVVMERLTTEQIADMKEYFSRSKKVKTSSLLMKLSHDGLKLIDTIEAQQQEINLLIMEITELMKNNAS